jgi:O-antigen/teichoic acid export membrane protein
MFSKEKQSLLNNGFYSLTGTILAGFFGYIFSFVLARLLSVVQFGEYQFFASVFVILGIVSSGLTYFVIKQTAVFASVEDYQSNYFFIDKIFRKIRLPVIIFLILFLTIFIFSELFKLNNLTALAIVGLSLIFSVLGSIYSGVLAGWQDFKRFALVNVLATLMRLLALILVFFYPSVATATLSFFFAGVANFVFGFFFSRSKWFKSKWATKSLTIKDNFKLEISTVTSALVLSIITIVISNIDVLLLKFFLNSETMGHYTVLALLGRVPFFISIAIIAVFLPKFCQAHNLPGQEKEKQLVRFSYLAVSLINVFFVIFYYLFSHKHIFHSTKFLHHQ